ncbi:MAG TPA: Fe-S-containing protein, partial [bacterium]
RRTWRAVGARAAAAAALAAILAAAGACAPAGAKYPEVRAVDGTVSLEAADVAAGSVRFFTFRDDAGRAADFFIYRDSGGTVRAAFDACRTCARWKKGYRLEGGKMVCIKCGMRFELDTLPTGIGSCVPVAVPVERTGGRLVIAAKALEEGERYF